jgi:plasmid stabilization system protein ParE
MSALPTNCSTVSAARSQCLFKRHWLVVNGRNWDGLRSFAVGNYVIFYAARSDGVEIVRVMNGRQDIAPEDMQ